jgi:two-component system, cell cycle sensor histidine kinase and response regulator CckA
MPNGGVITIETANRDPADLHSQRQVDVQSGAYVVLAVSDTGVGMTPDVQARIFEPFFTTKPPGRGTGLGLATIFGIVKQHQGNIEVDTAPGRGTAFRLAFPRVQQAIEPVVEAVPHATTGGGETVLLVEDDDGVRMLARLILARAGYRVLEGSHSSEAVRVAASHDGTIDVLVTDIVMPGASGRTLAQGLLARFPNLKVLYMSGYTDDAVLRHGPLEPGMFFLQKPFTPATLSRAVWEVLRS